ncbi:SDR family NAD(P)-dependent oxidoreductase [Methylobacterium sp. B4]|uniref:SDR family NAD(P)-dependent oxidoreductase n=1 Tax=Methylobacterium sp. B4 TaxID=1938755 RepID=UPI000D768530|nr:SDR family NAD(P)-dependent oxidoreductase [Methylobacterium sp. B4]PXW65910.1 short-subunit dehydrogenase [Methylobacterium sp. B4]
MKTFLSIGAGPGMGLATAERFAREGFRIVLSARNAGKTDALAGELRAKGHTVETRTVEAGDPDSVAALVAEVEQSFDGIDVLHYNAAAMRQARLADQPRDTFNGDLTVNVGGALAAAQAAVPGMSGRGGTILLTGGGFALQPHPDYLSLSIGKAGIRALAQGLFDSLKEQNIHVATVTIAGFVSAGSKDAEAVAERFWQLHDEPRETWSLETVYTP